MDAGLRIVEELLKYGPVGLALAFFAIFMKKDVLSLLRGEKDQLIPASKKEHEDLRHEFEEHKLEFAELKGVLKGKGHI